MGKERNEMSNNSFNLVDEKWIPCIMLDGESRELGILETLSRAHEIREIFDPSPLVTASLHRLLLAILHRNFGPASIEKWKNLWEAGQFDEEVLQGYFDKWRSRFDLFDKEHPFYQTAEFGKRKMKTVPVNDLLPEMAKGNNPTLFDHTFDDSYAPVDAATAVRNLLALQAYKLGGLSGLGPNFIDAPSARDILFFVHGNNLFHTLTLNLVRYDEAKNEPIPSSDDEPTWEQDQIQEASLPKGYLDYLTWQTLLLRLVTESSGLTIVGCKMALGRSLKNDGNLFDPAVAHRKSAKAGWLGLHFRENRALWRDSTSLLSIASEENRSPRTIQWLSLLVKRKVIEKSSIYRVDAYGLGTNQAKIDFWRRERLPLPLDYLADESLVEDLQTALNECEKAAEALRSALRYLAKGILAPQQGKADKNAVTNLVNHLGADKLYWSRLETPFYRLLTELPNSRNEALDTWAAKLRSTAWDAFNEATRGLDRSARTLKALVAARQTLGGKLKHVLS